MQSSVGLSRSGAHSILRAYENYRREFQRITRSAKERFDRRQRFLAQQEAIERLELYRLAIEELVGRLSRTLGESLQDPATWRIMKGVYSEDVQGLPDREIAETFFNSATRKVFSTVGVDEKIEYVDLDLRRDRYGQESSIHQTHLREQSTVELVARALASYSFETPWRDLEGDAAIVAPEIERGWIRSGGSGPILALELIEAVFYRGYAAYLVGRMRGRNGIVPLVLVLVNGEQGVEADAVLSTEREVSIVFSYTRAHFRVDVRRPTDVIRFLKTIMPKKPLAELYIALGYSKHGKTELYHGLMGHLGRSMDQFDFAPGEVGMVMIVFALRSFDYVFKVIRDEFAPPKTNTRDDVLQRYRIVFLHDRAGRLIEAQEFEHLVFEKRRFSPELLAELATSAAGTVTVTEGHVHIRHLYIERRVQPLDLFLRNANEREADQAVVDYGQAIRDLATTNIFPGDMLLKNFGVTRHGRVIFYDYDELSLVTQCEFREIPEPVHDDQDWGPEPWFYVGKNDVFPAEFLQFLGLKPRHRQLFLEAHADLLTAGFWRELKARHASGEVLGISPYPPAKQLKR